MKIFVLNVNDYYLQVQRIQRNLVVVQLLFNRNYSIHLQSILKLLHLLKKNGKHSFRLIFVFSSFEFFSFDNEKQQYEDQLNKVQTLLQYFREKLTAHGLEHQLCSSTPSPTLTSSLFRPITPYEEQTILSSYMDDKDSNSTSTTTTATAIAMKLPRDFLPLNLNSTTTNEIIHSPYHEGNEFEYKKELSVDIMDKYGGQQSKSKQFSNHGKKHKKNKKVR